MLFLFFILFLTDTSTVFGQFDSDVLHVSFVNNAAPSYDLEFTPNEKILLEQPYSWVRDQNSRYNLISYSIDGEDFTPISRLPRGTFTIDIPINSGSIIFLSVVQYPISIDGVKDYSLSPKSPTNDNWFDTNSKIKIIDVTSNYDGLIPYAVKSWEGPVIQSFGNVAELLVDGPVTVEVIWEPNYVLLSSYLAIPVVAALAFFVIKRKRKISPHEISQIKIKHVKHNPTEPAPTVHDNYHDEINQYLKQKSVEKLDSLLDSKIITNAKYSRIKENL